MYSQCPECLTRFRVTAIALRAAHGTVRCGRCGSAFDALQRLTDTVPDEAEPPPSPGMIGSSLGSFGAADRAGSGGAAASAGDDVEIGAGTEFHFSADDIEQVFIDARDWQRRFPRPADRSAPDGSVASAAAARDAGGDDDARESVDAAVIAADLDGSMIPAAGAPVVFVHEPEAIEDITLEGERIVIEGLPDLGDELREIAVDDAETPAIDHEAAHEDAVRLPGAAPMPVDPDPTDRFEVLHATPAPAVVDTPADAPVEAIVAGRSEAPLEAAPPIVPFRLRSPAATLDEAADELAETSGTPGRTAAAWGLGALVLAIALLAQLAHHYRQDLARDASLGPAVRALYARLGRPLAPNWDLAAFELRQWGDAGAVADDAITVRASLRNGAAFAQPRPLLRLELEDRFGETVARRDFEPREYLKDPAQASRLLAPGAETEAALDVVAAGTDAVGYRLDVCMRDETGAVRCAQSTPQVGPVPR